MNCFVVVEECGQYEDRYIEVLKGFTSIYRAQQYMQELRDEDAENVYMRDLCVNCRGENKNCPYRNEPAYESDICDCYEDYAGYEQKTYSIKEVEVDI